MMSLAYRLKVVWSNAFRAAHGRHRMPLKAVLQTGDGRP
jgi:hypothetical protein